MSKQAKLKKGSPAAVAKARAHPVTQRLGKDAYLFAYARNKRSRKAHHLLKVPAPINLSMEARKREAATNAGGAVAGDVTPKRL